MSDSVRPHGRQPIRLCCPWDSPGKNCGVGCHFLLQCMKVRSESEVAQSCLTLRDPMDCRPPGSSVHGIFQARVLEWGAIAFSSVVAYYSNWSVFLVLFCFVFHVTIQKENYFYLFICLFIFNGLLLYSTVLVSTKHQHQFFF